MNEKNLKQWKMNAPIGPIYLVASKDGLVGVLWKKPDVTTITDLDGDDAATRFLAQARHQLDEYFRGERKAFKIKLDIRGTVFQKNVWGELQKIPFGKTLSYKDVASNLKCSAFRAVGSANGRNPLSIIIPCHRVINADGKLGGYAGGLTIKEKLLALERQT